MVTSQIHREQTEPVSRIPRADLENLMRTLEVTFVGLSECIVSNGFGLQLGNVEATGLHYNLHGNGVAYIGNHPPIELVPHTLIVVPPNSPLRIEVAAPGRTVRVIDGKLHNSVRDGVYRFCAGAERDLVLICGFFQASYAASIDLFGTLSAPIVERFQPADMVDHKLNAALAELMSQEVGANAMTSALLKQVLVTLLRRSLTSPNSWVERFSLLRDPQIAKAFSKMVAEPGAPHTVLSLARSASLSRSAFMAHFNEVLGKSPMLVLRDLRMRQAARQLTSSTISVEQIASSAGYESRSSFIRAFRRAYGLDPSDFRTAAMAAPTS